MTGKRVYLQPKDMVMNAICDLVELQNGCLSAGDTVFGFIRFTIDMYGAAREYQFTVTDIGKNRCGVTVKMAGSEPDKERLIDHEFALLDYVLLDRARIEFAEIEEEDRQILAARKNRRPPGTLSAKE